jgi:4-amino-4-deoxy-L-arabinose transferase-like glycosyltransferase
MFRRNWLPFLLAILFSLVGLLLLFITLSPFDVLKMILDRLSRDQNLSLLTIDNAIAFRFLIGFMGVLGGLAAYVTLVRKWTNVGNFFTLLIKDCRRFFALKRSSTTKKNLGFLVAVLVITIYATVQRLAHIERPVLHDEAYTIVTFSDSLFHAITDYSLPNNHVFHSILVFFSIRIFGFAPWAARLPAFLAGVLVIPGVFFLANRLYDPWTGILASLLAAFSPDLIDYSTNARGYILVAFFTLVVLILGCSVLRNKNRFSWGLIILFSAIGLFTNPVMLFPFGILFAWLFFENLMADTDSYSSKWDFFRYWLFTGLITALLTWLLYTPILIYTGPHLLFANGFVAPVPWNKFLEACYAHFIQTWTQWTAGVPTPVIAVLGLGWVLALIFHKKISAIRFPLQLAAALWISILLVIQRPEALEKVWVFLLPLMLIWASAGVMGFLQKIHLNFAYHPTMAFVVAGILILMGGWSSFRWIPRLPELWSQRGEVENAVLFFKKSINVTDLIVVDSPDDSSVWFYALVHGIDNIHFDKRIPYTRAWILVAPTDGQTYTSVLAHRGPDIPPLDLASIKFVQAVGTRKIFECPIK